MHVRITEQNLAVMTAAGHPLYLIKTPDAGRWAYHLPITVPELPGLRFKRHLLMYATRGHREALELEVTAGKPPTRQELIGCTLEQS